MLLWDHRAANSSQSPGWGPRDEKSEGFGGGILIVLAQFVLGDVVECRSSREDVDLYTPRPDSGGDENDGRYEGAGGIEQIGCTEGDRLRDDDGFGGRGSRQNHSDDRAGPVDAHWYVYLVSGFRGDHRTNAPSEWPWPAKPRNRRYYNPSGPQSFFR